MAKTSIHPPIEKGMLFGALRTVRFEETKSNSIRWLCKCKCKNYKIVSISDLRAGKQKYCGPKCKQKAIDKGFRPASEGWIWIMHRNMMRRCYNSEDEAYHNYGGRGIKVYRPWHNYDKFRKFILDSLGKRPKDHEFDRINNDKSYSPSNVRWVSILENARNKRTNIYVIIKGKKTTLLEIYDKKPRPVSYNLVLNRYSRKGWKLNAALNTPLGVRHKNTQHLRKMK